MDGKTLVSNPRGLIKTQENLKWKIFIYIEFIKGNSDIFKGYNVTTFQMMVDAELLTPINLYV